MFFFEELVLSNLIASLLMKRIFYAWWVERGEVRKLEGLGWLVKGFNWFWLFIISLKTFISGSLFLSLRR